MKNEDIAKGRKKYQEFRDKKKKIYEKKKRIYELEKSPLIQEYLKLKNEISVDKKMKMNDIFPDYIDKKDSNEIYVFNEKRNHDFLEYIDIETSFSTYIPLDQKEKFEQKHIVLKGEDPNEIYNYFCKLLLTIKNESISEIQKEAVKRIIKKNNNLE